MMIILQQLFFKVYELIF